MATTFNSGSKSNILLQSKRYTGNPSNLEAYARVLDLNASEIYTQQSFLPTSSEGLPYSGSAQDGEKILSGSSPIACYYYRLPMTPSNVLNDSGNRRMAWFAVSGSDGSVAITPQAIASNQLANWVSNKYITPGQASRVAENATPNLVGYNVVISKGATAGAAEALPGSSYQFDYKTGVVVFVEDGGSNTPTTSEKIYISGYVYEGKTLADETLGGGDGTGAGFPFSGSAVITGSLVVSGSGASKTLIVDGEISASAGITGSLFGTATTASFVETAQTASFVTTAQTASFVTTAQTASNVDAANVTGTFTSIASSGTISGSALIESVGMTASLATFGSASIDHLTVNTVISGSTIITSGSNTFGDAMNDVQTLIGTTIITGSGQVTGSLGVSGSLQIQGITDVSASIAAAAEAGAGAGIFSESGSSGVQFTTSSLQVTGSTLEPSPIPSGNPTSTDGSNKYALVTSQSVWHYNANVGVPTSNAWGSTGLGGSYFENFDHNSDISEVLRFISGLLSSSAPNAAPNTKTYANIVEDIDNTTAGVIPEGSVPVDPSDTIVRYLTGSGFATEGERLFSPSGVDVDLRSSIKGNSAYHISYNSVDGGSTTVTSSADEELFGLGGKGLDFKVSGSNNYRFSNNASNTQTAVSRSSEILTNSTADSTSDGLTRATINTANPAVIPTAFQDGKFVDVFQANLYNDGVSLSTKESIGYYELSASIAIETGSGGYTSAKTAVERILYSPLTNASIGNGTISINTPFSESVSAVSRSLSGAPYLRNATWQYSSSISGLFEPLYREDNSVASVTDDLAIITMSAATGHDITLSTNGGTIGTNNVVFPVGGGTTRFSTTPHETDIVRFSGSAELEAGEGGLTNITQTGISPESFTLTTAGKNRNNTVTDRSDSVELFVSGAFGQTAESGSMAYYGYVQGHDEGSLTGTQEKFSGETYRIQINDNLLSGSYGNGDYFATASFGVNNLAKYDLQVKPGFLVAPGGSNGYWINQHPTTTGGYKYYARAFQISSGVKTNLKLDVGQALKKWTETGNGIAAAVMFESAQAGTSVGGFSALTRPKLYDFATLSGGDPGSNQATSDQLNPFSINIDIGGNQFGSLSSTEYTMPLKLDLNQVLASSGADVYTNFIILIRYRNSDGTGQQSTPLDSTNSGCINVSYT
jgi:hypothetical protein